MTFTEFHEHQLRTSSSYVFTISIAITGLLAGLFTLILAFVLWDFNTTVLRALIICISVSSVPYILYRYTDHENN